MASTASISSLSVVLHPPRRMLASAATIADVEDAAARPISPASSMLQRMREARSSIQVPIAETAGAAAVEAFYRSAMNTMINRRLTGVKDQLFPNMHIQVPTRMVYITGFKTLRYLVDNKSGIRPEAYGALELPVRLGMAITPGILMTPVSSVLEACNAVQNPEPLARKWMRGIVPRGAREAMYGIGLNQMSDHFREQAPQDLPPVLRLAYGSLVAGIISGYLSHIPHNLSSLKLINPTKSYGELFGLLRANWEKALSPSVLSSQPAARSALVSALCFIAPRGVLVRSTQIVGSFVILNGLITAFTSMRG